MAPTPDAAALMIALTGDASATTVTVHVVPGAARTGLAGIHGDALRIRIAAPPERGRANDALIAFLADVLELPTRDIALTKGHAARRKTVRIAGVAPAAVAARFAAHR